MKYAFVSFSGPQLTLGGLLDAARRYGYDGVDLRLDLQHRHGVELSASAAQRNTIRRQAVESGVALSCLATSCRLSGPDASAASRERLLRYIDLAADVGAPCLRVFGGEPVAAQERSAAIGRVAESLAAVSGEAQARGVAVCVETHDAWCLPDDLAAVMRRVNHPAIGVVWDILHPVRVHKIPIDQAFAVLQSWIRHVHVHDGMPNSTQLAPIGRGCIDHKRAIELLTLVAYGGFLSGEWINWSDPLEIHLPRELAVLKSYERSAQPAR